MDYTRIILHVDMDAFYPSVEQRERSEWKSKPVIVGADPQEGNGRGVVASSSYEAREFGVKSAMPISKAWKLCPQGIYVRPNFVLYARVSAGIMSVLRKYADKFEQVGIDEAFLDVTNKIKDYEEAANLAEKIKKDVLNKENVTCSIGIGPNKLIAKMASDYKKPYGTTVVEPDDVKRFLFPLSVRKLIGIGPKTEYALKGIGIETVEQLSKMAVEKLAGIFGVFGYRMHEMTLGIDDSEVTENYDMKSLGREVTFEGDTNDSAVIYGTLDRLVEEFHPEIVKSKILFKTVNVKVRYENFETHTRSKSFDYYTSEMKVVKETAKELMKVFLKSKRKIRLVGVRVSGLKFGEKQTTLKEIQNELSRT
ncbi:MAG: DNA polymerase IV [Candidatus Aenigmarchaeota archaeon]|nr:DNA polymerase IV [Candidatus Aenigmarchaeota archaeon]